MNDSDGSSSASRSMVLARRPDSPSIAAESRQPLMEYFMDVKEKVLDMKAFFERIPSLRNYKPLKDRHLECMTLLGGLFRECDDPINGLIENESRVGEGEGAESDTVDDTDDVDSDNDSREGGGEEDDEDDGEEDQDIAAVKAQERASVRNRGEVRDQTTGCEARDLIPGRPGAKQVEVQATLHAAQNDASRSSAGVASGERAEEGDGGEKDKDGASTRKRQRTEEEEVFSFPRVTLNRF